MTVFKKNFPPIPSAYDFEEGKDWTWSVWYDLNRYMMRYGTIELIKWLKHRKFNNIELRILSDYATAKNEMETRFEKTKAAGTVDGSLSAKVYKGGDGTPLYAVMKLHHCLQAFDGEATRQTCRKIKAIYTDED